jgi:hypothetical protein
MLGDRPSALCLYDDVNQVMAIASMLRRMIPTFIRGL